MDLKLETTDPTLFLYSIRWKSETNWAQYTQKYYQMQSVSPGKSCVDIPYIVLSPITSTSGEFNARNIAMASSVYIKQHNKMEIQWKNRIICITNKVKWNTYFFNQSICN